MLHLHQTNHRDSRRAPTILARVMMAPRKVSILLLFGPCLGTATRFTTPSPTHSLYRDDSRGKEIQFPTPGPTSSFAAIRKAFQLDEIYSHGYNDDCADDCHEDCDLWLNGECGKDCDAETASALTEFCMSTSVHSFSYSFESHLCLNKDTFRDSAMMGKSCYAIFSEPSEDFASQFVCPENAGCESLCPSSDGCDGSWEDLYGCVCYQIDEASCMDLTMCKFFIE